MKLINRKSNFKITKMATFWQLCFHMRALNFRAPTKFTLGCWKCWSCPVDLDSAVSNWPVLQAQIGSLTPQHLKALNLATPLLNKILKNLHSFLYRRCSQILIISTVFMVFQLYQVLFFYSFFLFNSLKVLSNNCYLILFFFRVWCEERLRCCWSK